MEPTKVEYGAIEFGECVVIGMIQVENWLYSGNELIRVQKGVHNAIQMTV